MKKSTKNIIIVSIILFIFFLISFSNLITDYLWFNSLDYGNIFKITLEATFFLFIVAFFISFIFIMLNLYLSSIFVKNKPNSFNLKIKIFVSLIISIIIGRMISFKWFEFMNYLKQTPFNIVDPIFNKDISFYIFSLPFYNSVVGFAIFCLVITIILVLINYFQTFVFNTLKQFTNPKVENSDLNIKSVNFKKEQLSLKKHAFFHLSVLFSILFLLFSLNHYLSKFLVLNSFEGVVSGASYTDVNVVVPSLNFLSLFALFIAVFFIIWCILYINKKTKLNHIFGLIIIYFFMSFILLTILPYLVQSFKVTPNEINLEQEYIEYNINFTRKAYGLNNIEEIYFNIDNKITWDILNNNKETIDNIRLLDQKPLTQTYRQTQEMRLYYDLSSIDIDRYYIDGKYTQVMISARELNQKRISSTAQTWINNHLIYTHGYGIVMSPVNKVTNEGLPDYLIKDIPPIYTTLDESLKIDKPEIYFGELDNDYIIVNTNTKEFDYPFGSENVYAHYEGKGGIILDSFFKKLLMVLKFKDIKILLSSEITKESKIMYYRNVMKRSSFLMPFIILDNDPYVVINDGKLFWIIDGYTITSNYPYSDNMNFRHNNYNFNYIRNSVKIVIDAYNGDVSYYVIDEDDPLIKTYKDIFPGVFKNINQLPYGLKNHLRYPEGLFKIQSNILTNYHMQDYKVFYNKEDAWQIPNEIYGQGNQIQMDPYYIIMKLPDTNKEEFILMTPFTPIQKNNMVSWLAARADGDNYGKLLLYRFPKDKLVYGPMQIEARIDQDSYISQQFTLWSQRGSNVLRGNLLIIPIDNSLLYVEPIYLESQSGQLPQLVRVIVSDGEQVVMENTLSEALEVLVGRKPQEKQFDEDGILIIETDKELIIKANKAYEEILESMRKTDWNSIGKNLDELGLILNQLLNEED
jgi:uncharacterized protein